MCEQTVGSRTIPVQIIFETMARIVRGKKFERSVGVPTIPVQVICETMARFVRGKKV